MQEQFEKFLENIKLTAAQREDAATKYTGVCKKLHDFYYPNLAYDGTTKLLIGSYGKHTHIRPARDIDVIFIMPPEKFDRYNDNQSNKQSQLLNDIRNILLEKYPNTPIKAFGKVVALEFTDTRHNVELLPAWENGDGTFVIPNSENGGSWEHWDPRAEIQKIQDSDFKTGKTRSLIRMIKKWSENCTAKVKSFEIENKVLAFFNTNDFEGKEYPALVKEFFDYFHSAASNIDLKSHPVTAINRATKACEFETKSSKENAAEEWRKVFGDDFPATIQSVSLPVEVKPTLADYSHCEPLRWPLAETVKVRIDADIYDNSRQKKLGGINSDGRNLRSGLGLRYRVQTAVVGPFDYYWQVVNTGQAARADGGLRGNIFPGKEVQWESTKYFGKHWIECFLVQNEVCVARSRKFLINIK